MIDIAGELLTQEEIKNKVKELAKEIEGYFGGEDIVVVSYCLGVRQCRDDIGQ